MQYSLIQEQGVRFAIVVVQEHVIQNQMEARRTISEFENYFGVPVIILGGQSHQTIGRQDIVRFLSNINISQIQWQYADV